MFCKECGTENLDTEIECKKCNFIINSNLPLNGQERVYIIGFFVGLLITIFFGIIPIIICLILLFIIKKDKSMKILENGKKVFLGYLIILSIFLSSIAFLEHSRYSQNAEDDYKEYLKDKNGYSLNNSENSKFQSNLALATGFIAVPVCTYIIYFLSNFLFFKILKRHENWIIENGLFADSKNEKSFIEKTTEKIQAIKKEPVNNVDEILKWAELKEKGLITEEEFIKAKEKILEGKL